MTKVVKQSSVSNDTDQWIMLINDECLISEESNKPTFCKLRHPRSSSAAMFLFCHDNKQVFQVLQFKEEFRGWFAGQSLQPDGSMFVTSAVNPVFLILHYLIKASKDGKFTPLDHMLVDEEFPECSRLSHCVTERQLEPFTEVKGPDDLRVYKFSPEKSLSWLQSKVDEVADSLAERNVNVRGGAQAATYVKTDTKREDYVRFAHGLLSEYLPVTLSIDLLAHMGPTIAGENRQYPLFNIECGTTVLDVVNTRVGHGPTIAGENRQYPLFNIECGTTVLDVVNTRVGHGIKDPVVLHEKPSIEEPNAKRQKKDLTPTEDYSKNGWADDNKPAPKLTKAQKTLSKVDKSGMKSIASFFSPKGK